MPFIFRILPGLCCSGEMSRPLPELFTSEKNIFINKPPQGWLHSDNLISKKGVTYAVRVSDTYGFEGSLISLFNVYLSKLCSPFLKPSNSYCHQLFHLQNGIHVKEYLTKLYCSRIKFKLLPRNISLLSSISNFIFISVYWMLRSEYINEKFGFFNKIPSC